ncbi:hypothetical protein F4780DRAFT_718326 [Xylariomycetidae sp. FL0641]|nr:hypothetical protein F4780DRAFT_718326 [Xylariomycetidae sp. FL0641]
MAPQDTFIDDEEDTCPLCIEEFDLSDRNFRPCPCGYQICQFCYNNLKNNLNGLCPACRRPYDEKDIQWKVVTHEEEAEFRANIQKNQKKRATEQRQKEVQKREAERENRKNLQGVRVVQKNLVYVTGLTPNVREDELLRTLRRPEFFGQYGNIQKISISNRKGSDGQQQSLGIYVTFEKKEEAARCIQAVNHSQNGDRILKAQLGTTKYCSAWLRHEQCGNRQCMFLHELGDEEDSYTRQDLSSLNSVHTQRPLAGGSSSRSASRQQAPIASQPMVRTSSKEGSDAGEGPALPASANWARTTQQRSRRGSHATSGAASSPAIASALPVTTESTRGATDATINETPATSRKAEKRPATESPSQPNPADTRPEVEDNMELVDLNILLKMLATCSPSAFAPSRDSGESLPPMFDLNGAERRRAMRDEDESRLHEEHGENREPSEGEPESGSLALGGEPEDRDQGRSAGGFDQRRNLTQPPIQRSGASDLFGPSLTGFGSASATVGSIGSRTMTPQQQLFMRPQSSFADQMPPGISQPASLFQGQGHSRQQSRFSFANENSSSSVNVKSTGDPRYMAQQSSMMPSSYRSQPGSMYATSVPGPPPGLKSTGTPPVSGGMFGQGHSFGGSAFGAASKDNSNELLQSLIRGRGAGGSQAHDAGKREYISHFNHNQYLPSTSSTPAPASAPGLLASLYASQSGAFPDFGPKQKKKGKKHRHANTSSSGGSGLVDLADPSILRMHHNQQGASIGVGQGLFGGQTQDDELNFDEAPFSVDALVSDSYPLEPPGLLAQSGTTTPSLPPGFGLTHGHPPVQFGEKSPSVNQDHKSTSATAIRPVTPALPRPITPVVPKSVAKSTPSRSKVDTLTPSDNDAKKNIKELATTSGLAKDIAAQASKSSKGKLLQEEDFPALDSVKTGSPSRVTPALPAKPVQTGKPAQAKKQSADTASKPPAEPTPKKSEKRPVPGTLDIAAATNTATQSTAAKSSADKSSAPQPTGVQPNKTPTASALPTPLPTTPSVSSPLAKAVPKTLRLVQTPKAETPPNIPPAAVASIRSAAAASAGHRPATPGGSEPISDTASVISASISASRTSSPPPSSKVGAASVRATTKSQQRKQRKEASKEAAAQIAETKPIEQEVEIAPILGRKKKQKKEKRTAPVSRASSRPETPLASESQGDGPNPEKAAAASQSGELSESAGKGSKATTPPIEQSKAREQKPKDAKSPPRSPAAVDTSIRLNESTKTTVLTPDYVNPSSEVKPEQPVDEDVGDIPNLRDVFHALVEEEGVVDPEKTSFFKPVQAYRPDPNGLHPVMLPPTLKAIVTKEDEEKLNAFQPVRKTVNDQPVLLTPNGDCLLNLTEEEAELFLDLQDRLRADSIRPTAFAAPRHAPASGFSLVKNRAVPNGTPSFFPSGPDNYPSDPVGKMHREEAISCINQHVLPSLNLGSYKTMGPNANFAKNVNLQQLAPWIYPSTENAEDQRKMFAPRVSDDVAGGGGADGPYASYEHPDAGPSPAIGSTPLMSVEDAETVWSHAKKAHEMLDKKFRQLQAKNRRLVDMH